MNEKTGLDTPILEKMVPTSSVPGTVFTLVNFEKNALSVAPFKGGKFVVEPGVRSKLDIHDVRECWIMASGEGVLYYDGKPFEVTAGDFLFFESQHSHQIENKGDEDIVIYSVWWNP